ncbi:MAG: N-acetylglucosamine-6-phosphate deacetylase [Planctomycetota bacterium]|nr:N-acetylglucosamine-6-phosphate deacetylase [Planctomycetota bacterium]
MNTDNDISVMRDENGRIVGASGSGLVDLQVNGYAGVDFNDSDVERLTLDKVRGAFEAMRRCGVVSVLVTIVTGPIKEMIARVARMVELQKQDDLLKTMIAGFHIEGPLISGEDGPRGAHPAENVMTPQDTPNLLDELQSAAEGAVRLLTLAPELPGAMELIAKAAADGITVALGHHNADAETIDRAVRAGARMCTHLGNGSHMMLPRLDNYLQRQLADDRLSASFIADGHHIPFTTLKNFIRAKTPRRSILVTDAIMAANMPPGQYQVGEVTCRVEPNGMVWKPGEAFLVGSALTMDRAVLNVAGRCDVSFETAWAMASTQPAELVGMPKPARIEVDVIDNNFVRK